MGKWTCDYRYLLIIAALAFFYIQMRLFATQSHYADKIAAAVEAENHCTSQMRLLIDQISMQQGQIVALQEEKKRQDEKCRQLSALIQDLERKGVKEMIGEVQVPVAAVVVMACNRADYLERTIKSILKYQEPIASKYPLFVSQDGTNSDVKRKALSYNQLTYMQVYSYSGTTGCVNYYDFGLPFCLPKYLFELSGAFPPFPVVYQTVLTNVLALLVFLLLLT